jgi:energy-converting hydrogenase Eha subunit G
MSSTKKVIYILGGLVAVTGLVFYFLPPKAKVIIKKDGSGIASLGGVKKEFTTDKGVDIITFNGYELHADSKNIWLRKWGRDVLKKDGTPKVEIVTG